MPDEDARGLLDDGNLDQLYSYQGSKKLHNRFSVVSGSIVRVVVTNGLGSWLFAGSTLYGTGQRFLMKIT